MKWNTCYFWVGFLPVTVEICREDPTLLSVGGVLFIHPPYTPCSCQSTNEIILSRIQWLLKKDSNVSSDTSWDHMFGLFFKYQEQIVVWYWTVFFELKVFVLAVFFNALDLSHFLGWFFSIHVSGCFEDAGSKLRF